MNDDYAPGTIRLHTGGVTADPVLKVVSGALERLRKAGLSGMLAFADAVELARDGSFELPPTSQQLIAQEGLLDEDGRMDPALAEVVRASATGKGYSIQAIDPITGR